MNDLKEMGGRINNISNCSTYSTCKRDHLKKCLVSILTSFFFSFTRLQLKTDKEKCMAWIRQALKENTLSSYLNVITQDDKLLRYIVYMYLTNISL